MDFDDDMQDSDNVDSSSNDSYSEDMGSEGYGYRNDDDDAGDCGFVDEDSDASDDIPSHRQLSYNILSETDIRRLQEEDINRLSNLLSVSRSDACILLRHYCWNSSKVHDEWFTDEGNVRKVAGLLESPAIMLKAREINCRICFESCLHDEMRSATCGHKFCQECWRGYIATAVNDGPGCLLLRCPDPSCLAAIGQDMVNLLACDEDKEKYSRYLLRSYIEENKKIKWCPAPGCDFAVNFDTGTSYDVSCRCTHSFCWNCAEDAHRPVLCDTVNKWILKNSAESENMNWILANSKPCPECKRPIEKNHGCMHMTCTAPCKFEFCWLCLGSWKEHGQRTGGFYSCNSYETAKKQGVFDEDEMRRERAKSSLEKYMHYYERWATNQSSRKKAQVDLVSTQTEKLVKLSAKLCKPETDLTFITEAWEQIVECRRVLTWTYAYGYYLPECEIAKKQLFEYLQGEAESGLERLHKCAEKELEAFEEKYPLEKDLSETLRDFSAYRTTLVGLTSVTRKYFENLVNCLENGLQEVVAPVSKASKSKNRKGAGSGSPPITYADYVEGDYWQCNICTFLNAPGATACEMCGPLD